MISDSFIVIRELKIQNANALSSAFTIGFPAMTAWLGAVHAIQRKFNEIECFAQLEFNQIAVACHDFKLHTYKGRGDFDWSIVGTGNPLTKEGTRPSFIEEGRCNLCVSLIIGCNNLSRFDFDDFETRLESILHSRTKVAGGDILEFANIEYKKPDSENEKQKLLYSLMPGYVLIERRDLVKASMENGDDALDAILDHVALHNVCEKTESGEVSWSIKRKTSGWVIPIAVGFQGISELVEPGKTFNQRDPSVPHRFAEAIVTLGEFKMPHRLRFDDAFWHYEYRKEENLYLCKNFEGEKE
jgi:CRISPR-associated protein Csy2